MQKIRVFHNNEMQPSGLSVSIQTNETTYPKRLQNWQISSMLQPCAIHKIASTPYVMNCLTISVCIATSSAITIMVLFSSSTANSMYTMPFPHAVEKRKSPSFLPISPFIHASCALPFWIPHFHYLQRSKEQPLPSIHFFHFTLPSPTLFSTYSMFFLSFSYSPHSFSFLLLLSFPHFHFSDLSPIHPFPLSFYRFQHAFNAIGAFTIFGITSPTHCSRITSCSAVKQQLPHQIYLLSCLPLSQTYPTSRLQDSAYNAKWTMLLHTFPVHPSSAFSYSG